MNAFAVAMWIVFTKSERQPRERFENSAVTTSTPPVAVSRSVGTVSVWDDSGESFAKVGANSLDKSSMDMFGGEG